MSDAKGIILPNVSRDQGNPNNCHNVLLSFTRVAKIVQQRQLLYLPVLGEQLGFIPTGKWGALRNPLKGDGNLPSWKWWG